MTEPTSTGVDARLASVLCYAGWWVTGLVFLFVERRDQAVRFHAAQSLVVFGTLSAVFFLCGGASAFVFFWSPPAFQMVQAIGNLLWLGDGAAVAVPAGESVAGGNLAGASGRRSCRQDRQHAELTAS